MDDEWQPGEILSGGVRLTEGEGLVAALFIDMYDQMRARGFPPHNVEVEVRREPCGMILYVKMWPVGKNPYADWYPE